MKFGVNVLNFGNGATAESMRRWARRAEETGFHLAMVSDHVSVTGDVASQYPAPFYDAFATLSWLTGATESIELGTTVAILPYRHPLQTARVCASIDQFSNGRFILGVGAGWAREEYAALGVAFQRRGAITDEYLAAIKELWTNDIVSMRGTFVSFAAVHTAPRPVRAPHPPIWVGGASPSAIRRAARHGDAWHPINPRLDWLRDFGVPALHAEAVSAGRPMPALCPRIPLRFSKSRLDDRIRRPGEGTLDQVHLDLKELVSLGAEYVLFDTYAGADEDQGVGAHWPTLQTLADNLVDLAGQTLR